jgi:hypothetical protein
MKMTLHVWFAVTLKRIYELVFLKMFMAKDRGRDLGGGSSITETCRSGHDCECALVPANVTSIYLTTYLLIIMSVERPAQYAYASSYTESDSSHGERSQF